MLVACSVGAIILAATYATLEQGLRTHAVGAARAESQQAARAAVERLAQEVRNAGRGARGSDAPAITVAELSRIVLASDLDDDGTTSARGELITWQLVGSVLRRNAGAGAQPVINGVRAFELLYFDAGGRPTTNPSEVRVVDVALEVGLSRGVANRMTTRV